MRVVPSLVLFLSGLVIGAAGAYLALKPASALERRDARTDKTAQARSDDTKVAAVAPQVPVDLQTIPDHDWWAKEGFAEMVPPVHLPTNGPERDHIRVWLKIPDGKKVAVRKLPDGTPSIRFPAGTRSDRVESYAVAKNPDGKAWPATWTWTVGDVRGTTLTDTGELFHVFVPSKNEPRAPLTGWEWRRGDEAQQRQATKLLVQHLKAVPTMTDEGTMPTDVEQRQLIDAYARNNLCVRCHYANKPEQIDVEQAIHRRTDDQGWYIPYAVLFDRMPVESHRPRDRNADDPFVTITCPDGSKPDLQQSANGARRHRCAKGSAVGVRDVKAGLAKKDPATVALCESRKYLWEHMDGDGRAAFAAAFDACGIR